MSARNSKPFPVNVIIATMNQPTRAVADLIVRASPFRCSDESASFSDKAPTIGIPTAALRNTMSIAGKALVFIKCDYLLFIRFFFLNP